MSFKSILVHADDQADTLARVELAARIAARASGALLVLYTPQSIDATRPRRDQRRAGSDEQSEAGLELAKRVTAIANVPCAFLMGAHNVTILSGAAGAPAKGRANGPGSFVRAQLALSDPHTALLAVKQFITASDKLA